jgi:molecular chaperone DnaJ
MEKDLYKVLGVDKSASEDDLKKAYHTLSKRYHPDVQQGKSDSEKKEAEERFKEINEAYQVLSDPEKRKKYDWFGNQDDDMSGFENMDPFGMFSSMRHTYREKGSDLRITLNITMAEAYEGIHKKLKIKKSCICHRCHGSGSDDNEFKACPECGGRGVKMKRVNTERGYMATAGPCPNCRGTGKVVANPCGNCKGTGLESGEEEVEFDVPKGMPFDAYFVIQGKGNDASHRGIPGDLIVIVTQSEEDKKNNPLVRDGNDLLYTLKVNYSDLINGCDISVPYINGEQKIHLPEGTESGTVISLFRKGFPDPNDNTTYGNYKITVECMIPKKSDLNSTQREALKKFFG